MDMIKLRIPYEYIAPRCELRWHDALFGLQQELMDPRAAVKLAENALITSDVDCGPLFELAAREKLHEIDIVELTTALAQAEPGQSDETAKEKWLFLTLCWILEYNDEDSALKWVDEVYADFEYPDEIANLISYMPATPDEEGPRGRAGVMYRWRKFIASRSKYYRHLA